MVGNGLNFLEFFHQVSSGRSTLRVGPIGGLLGGVQEHVLVGRQGVEILRALMYAFPSQLATACRVHSLPILRPGWVGCIQVSTRG